MYELIQVGSCSYYIDCPSKMGIYRQNETDIYLIDSGNDKEAGRKARQIIDSNKWNLKGILITHAHADHIGGCKYLQQITNCKIFAPKIEDAIANNTVLEPSMLYGGNPFKDLKIKSLMAQECECFSINSPDFPQEIEVIPLPGHSNNMVGYMLPDCTFFIADSLSSAETLEKYKITFIYDVEKYLNTLQLLPNIKANIYVPAHAKATNDINDISDINIKKTLEIANTILSICTESQSFDTLLQSIFNTYNLNMNLSQYVLNSSTVKSYLTYLLEQNKIEYFFENNMMKWKSTESKMLG